MEHCASNLGKIPIGTICMTYTASWRFRSFVLAAMAALLFIIVPAFADQGEGPLNPAEPTGITSDEIIKKFATKEKVFKQARDNYTYRQSVTVETLDADTVAANYRITTDIMFYIKGHVIENVVFPPQPPLTRIPTQRDYTDAITNTPRF